LQDNFIIFSYNVVKECKEIAINAEIAEERSFSLAV